MVLLEVFVYFYLTLLSICSKEVLSQSKDNNDVISVLDKNIVQFDQEVPQHLSLDYEDEVVKDGEPLIKKPTVIINPDNSDDNNHELIEDNHDAIGDNEDIEDNLANESVEESKNIQNFQDIENIEKPKNIKDIPSIVIDIDKIDSKINDNDVKNIKDQTKKTVKDQISLKNTLFSSDEILKDEELPMEPVGNRVHLSYIVLIKCDDPECQEPLRDEISDRVYLDLIRLSDFIYPYIDYLRLALLILTIIIIFTLMCSLIGQCCSNSLSTHSSSDEDNRPLLSPYGVHKISSKKNNYI